MSGAADTARLARLLSGRFGGAAVELSPVAVRCAWPVFRADVAGSGAAFVKVTEREPAERTLRLLADAAGCPLLPRPLLADAPDLDGRAVLCLEWKASERVDAEAMTDAQLDSFADGCAALSDALARYRGAVSGEPGDAPEAHYAALADYAARHPLAGRLLRPLLAIPESERTYGGRPLRVIHGDLQPRNYGFEGDRLSAVYDTDDLTVGLACEDACYAFTERARRSELTAARRARLAELFRRLVARSPWPRGDWLVAVNRDRLRIAARRIASHPRSPLTALDIARRDRPLRVLAALLGPGDGERKGGTGE